MYPNTCPPFLSSNTKAAPSAPVSMAGMQAAAQAGKLDEARKKLWLQVAASAQLLVGHRWAQPWLARGMQRPRQPASILATTLVFSSVPAGPGFLPPEVTFASTLLMSINRCSATPQSQLWQTPLPYSSFQPTGKNPQIQEENNHLTLPPSSRGPGGNSWVIESDQNYRDIASKEAQKNVDSLESWRDAGLNVPWMHSSGLGMML